MRPTMIFAAVLALAPLPSHGAPGLGSYSFDYAITGDRAVRPVQVFDDGRTVYIQLPVNMSAPPAVLEKVGEQVRPIRFRYEFPYLVVDNARGEIVLAFDGRTAFVTKRSGVVTGASTSAVITGVATPSVPVASVQPKPADRADYSGEMVFRQMRGSSLPSNHQPVRVATESSPAPIAQATRAPFPEDRGAVSFRAPNTVARHYAAAGHGERTVVHRVRSGESLGGIAAQHGVPASRIATDNGITNPNLIRVGQALTINKPDRTIMASANRVQNIAAVTAPVRSPTPVVVERAAPPVRVAAQVRVAAAPAAAAPRSAVIAAPRVAATPVRVAMTTPHAAPSFASIAPAPSPSGRVAILRVLGASPKIDAKLLAAVRRVVDQQGEIMLRGHSSAMTTGERSATANASAEAVRDQLIKNGIPADRLTLVSNPGRVMSPSRVDVVLIGSKESVDA